MDNGRIPLKIAVQPWFYDHSFGGKAVLPAVEAMLFLAGLVHTIYPGTDIRRMQNATFGKFLDIPRGVTPLKILFEGAVTADGRVQAQMLSRTRGTSMSRIKEHCRVCFSQLNDDGQNASIPISFGQGLPKHARTEIKVDHLYQHLVPFGPMYRTLQGTLFLAENEAWGSLRAADVPPAPGDASQKILGSPFPLDGAMHAACVLGQQSVDFVPFPVGFAERVVTRATRPGAWYITQVKQTGSTGDELVFDLAIWDNAGQLYEMVSGLRMRNVGRVLNKA